MADVAAPILGGGFSIGRVGSRTFEVLGRNFVNFFVLAVLAVLPQILFSASIARTYGPTGLAAAVVTKGYWLSFLGATLLSLVMSFVLQAALTYGTIMDLNGRRVSLGEALLAGLKVFLPVALISILFGLGFVVGFVLFIVPGLMLLTAWLVVVPVRVAEGTDIVDSFSRSAELTKGHRWPIFGIMVIYLIGVTVLELVTAPIIALSIGGQLGGWPILSIVLQAIEGGVTAVISATGVACIYYELRSVKEGMGPEQLAAVFD